MVVVSGSHKGAEVTVESLVFQQSVDYPKELAAGYHVVLNNGRAVAVRWDQVRGALSRAQPMHCSQSLLGILGDFADILTGTIRDVKGL